MCKCRARTFKSHLDKVRKGYPGHVFTGFHWSPATPGGRT